jgi:hypothetical protein
VTFNFVGYVSNIMNAIARRPHVLIGDSLHRFTAAYACIAVAASVAALGLQTFGHFTGLFGTALVVIAVPAITGAIAGGCFVAVALAGIVEQAFVSNAVRLERAQTEQVAAK